MLELRSCICRKSTRQRKTAIWIRESLLALGPTFIKIGQLFSTRSDLLAAEYTKVCAPDSVCDTHARTAPRFISCQAALPCPSGTCSAPWQLQGRAVCTPAKMQTVKGMSQNSLLQELSLLQDRVPAFDPARAVAIVEDELGMPLASAYRSFEREPIAAASLGQVRCCSPLSILHSGRHDRLPYSHILG